MKFTLIALLGTVAGIATNEDTPQCFASLDGVNAVDKGTDIYQSPSLCAQNCGDQFSHVALRNGSHCYCLSQVPTGNSGQCDTVCNGYGLLKCGLATAYSVYSIRNETFNITQSSSATPPNFSQIAGGLPVYNHEQIRCVGGIGSLADSKGNQTFQTPSFCAQQCDSKYVALRGAACYCLDLLPDSANATCNIACPGYGKVLCGGDEAYSVYWGKNGLFVLNNTTETHTNDTQLSKTTQTSESATADPTSLTPIITTPKNDSRTASITSAGDGTNTAIRVAAAVVGLMMAI